MLFRHDIVLMVLKSYLQPCLALLVCSGQAEVNKEEESDTENEDLRKEPTRKRWWTKQPVKIKEFIDALQ